MRELFTSEEATERGLGRNELRAGERLGRWRHLDRNVWGMGPDEPSDLDRRRAAVLAAKGVACGTFAGLLLQCDGVHLGPDPFVALRPGGSHDRAGACRRRIASEDIANVAGVPCTSGLRTLLDLALVVDDEVWEQALESVLRRRLTTVAAIESRLGRSVRGSARIRRVLERRGRDVAATESRLETLFVQLARLVPGLPPPVRQYRVVDHHGVEVARVDLCWPELGLFVELDGEHHKDQPRYDARRETAVIAATGWLVGRFTWHEVTRVPKTTARRLADLVAQCQRRPLIAG